MPNESNQESGSKSLVADKESPKRKLVKESDADAETSKNTKDALILMMDDEWEILRAVE